jgi:alkylation response protein AidB-like acyl-CoA dehydrogenase
MYRLNAQQQAIVDKAEEVAEQYIKPHADEVDAQGAFPREAIEALGREGFLGLTIAPEYGGMGQSLRVACAVLDQISQRCASTSMVYLMHLCGVACYSAASGQAANQLRNAAAGNHLSTRPGANAAPAATSGRR